MKFCTSTYHDVRFMERDVCSSSMSCLYSNCASRSGRDCAIQEIVFLFFCYKLELLVARGSSEPFLSWYVSISFLNFQLFVGREGSQLVLNFLNFAALGDKRRFLNYF